MVSRRCRIAVVSICSCGEPSSETPSIERWYTKKPAHKTMTTPRMPKIRMRSPLPLAVDDWSAVKQIVAPMTSADASPTTLLGLTDSVPAGNTAIIVPEQNLKITYAALRENVTALAETLAAAGIKKGDRIGMAMPNGLACVVSFLASSMAGTSAPLNPGYKDEEFQFFLDDTNARVILLPPDGLPDARSAAQAKGTRVLIVDTDASGNVSIQGLSERKQIAPPDVDDVALILHTSGSTGRPKRVPLSHKNLSISARNV